MADAQLNIVLKLLDEASGKLKDTMDAAKAQTDGLASSNDELGKAAKKAHDQGVQGASKHKDALLKARDAVRAFHKEIFVIALAIGAATAAMSAFAERNDEARATMDRIGLAFKNWGAVLGSAIAPYLDRISEWIEKLNSGLVTGKLSDVFERASISLKNFDADLKKLQTTFQGAEMLASDFYSKMLDKQTDVIAMNKMMEQSFTQLATLQSQLISTEIIESQRKTQEQIRLLNEYKTNYMIAHQGMAAFTATVSESIRTNLSGALTDVITGAKTAKEAFSELGKMLIQTVVDFMVQKLVAWALEKTLLAGTVTSSIIAGSAIAAAWAPAAAMVSLATFGANAGPAAAAVIGINALSQGLVTVSGTMSGAGKVLAGSAKFHDGGMIYAHDGLAVDEVPIIAQTGEGILSRRGMAALGGSGQLKALNRGQSVGGGGEITVNIYYPKMSSMDEVKKLADDLGLQIERQLRYVGV